MPRPRFPASTVGGHDDALAGPPFCDDPGVGAAVAGCDSVACREQPGAACQRARRGSGFSFSDIAADRAGTRFGELATTPSTGIQRLQQMLARGLQEADLLPDVRDLPEFMAEAEFQRRFGGIGQPAYLEMIGEIERRIAALPLYR